MQLKNQVKFNLKRQKIIIILSFLTLFILAEPSLLAKFTFAVSLSEYPRVNFKSVDNNYPIVKNSSSLGQEKSHAPEASTLFLILSGIGGMIVRFAQKSFERFKRDSDIFLSILGLFIASPVLILAMIFIKLTSKGQLIYRHNRVGKNGEIFKIYKLRTMWVDAEKNTGVVWAKENDPRITPVGRVLRRTHVDEIPQLFNVLKGEMSIVGPRPERPELVRDLKQLIRGYEKRLQVKPGITGLAQVWHKYDETIEDVKKKIRYDLLYIRKMCLLADLRILAQTVVVVLMGKGAR